MRTLTLSMLSLVLALTASGCKDDDAGGSGDGTGTTAEATTSSEGSATAASTGPSTTGDGTVGGSGDESSTGATEALFGGDVYDFETIMGIPDATISVYDMPGVSTISETEGVYEIGPLPLDPPPIFVVDPNDTYFGSVRPVGPDETDTPDDIRLAQVGRMFIDMQIGYLQDQMPAEPDLQQSIILVRLLHAQALGTVIEMDPPPEAGTYFSPDGNGLPVLDSNEIQFGLIPVVVYFNVTPADPGTYTFTATHPERECTVVRPDFPTLGEHITLVDVSCPPP